jgi:nitrogen regulatory protein PII
MKAVFISYNQASTEAVDAILSRLHIRGYTKWEHTMGRGTTDGEPHMGTHTWPSMNSSILTIVEDDKVQPLLDTLRKFDEKTKEQGLKAYVWGIDAQL